MAVAASSIGKPGGPNGGTASGQPLFVFLSELIGRPVEDSLGAPLGRLEDLTIAVADPFPRVRHCVIRQARTSRLRLLARWADVARLDGPRLQLGVPAAQLTPAAPEAIDETRLRSILDRQVVDTSGLKVVRVNDIQLLATGNQLRAIHVDVGFRGLVRRLGVEPLVDRGVRRVAPRAGYLTSDNLISWRYVETLAPGSSPHSLQLSLSRAQIHQAHPVDVADLLAGLDPVRRLRLFRALDPEAAARALAEVPAEVQIRLIEMMPHHEAADVLERMSPDEAADLLSALPEEMRGELLGHMEHEEASDVAGLLEHAEGTAGALMTTDFVVLSDRLSIGEALESLRQLAPDAETINYLYVVDELRRLVGVLSVRALIIESPSTPVAQVMLRRPVSVQADDSLDECASLVARYNLLALPVVRPDRTMLGVITVDDVLGEVLEQAWSRKLAHR